MHRGPLPPDTRITPPAHFHYRTVTLHCYCVLSSESLRKGAAFYSSLNIQFLKRDVSFVGERKRMKNKETKRKKKEREQQGN